MRSTGKSKRNIPLPILKNEPMGRNNEYTYKVFRLTNAGGYLFLTERVDNDGHEGLPTKRQCHYHLKWSSSQAKFIHHLPCESDLSEPSSTFFRLPQIGHHLPSLICFGAAFHRCPAEHSHKSLVLAFMYLRDKHLPPRSWATFCICSIDNFVERHTGHQLPRATLVGMASHLWHLSHSQSILVLLLW